MVPRSRSTGATGPPHSLTHATVAEVRSTFVHALRAADRPWADVADAMRRTVRTAHADADVPPLRLNLDGRADRSPLATATVPEVRAMFVASLRSAGRPWAAVARVMRCSTGTARSDSAPRVIRLLHREALAHAG